MYVCVNSVKPCFPTSKANSQMPEATVSVCMAGLVFTTHCQTSSLQSTMAALLLLLGCYNTEGLPVTIISWDFILLLHYIAEGNIGLFSALYLSDFARFLHTKVKSSPPSVGTVVNFLFAHSKLDLKCWTYWPTGL